MSKMVHGGRPTCESLPFIDVRRWHREGRLHPGQHFPCSWTWGGESLGSIIVQTEAEAVVLMFRSRTSEEGEWKSIEQRVPIAWTECHLGGRRAWFRCTVYSGGRYCGRRVALLYGAGELFACRRCYRLPYASQHESLRHRGLEKARKIRMRLGGSANMFDAFPDKPKGMHWRTYEHLRNAYNAAEARSTKGLMRIVDRLQHLLPRTIILGSSNDRDVNGTFRS
jgi:hypothetical protein